MCTHCSLQHPPGSQASRLSRQLETAIHLKLRSTDVCLQPDQHRVRSREQTALRGVVPLGTHRATRSRWCCRQPERQHTFFVTRRRLGASATLLATRRFIVISGLGVLQNCALLCTNGQANSASGADSTLSYARVGARRAMVRPKNQLHGLDCVCLTMRRQIHAYVAGARSDGLLRLAHKVRILLGLQRR